MPQKNMPLHDTVAINTIGALLSLQPMIPPGCSEGLDAFIFFLKNLQQYNASTAAASVYE